MTQSHAAASPMSAAINPVTNFKPRRTGIILPLLGGVALIICVTLFVALRAEWFKRPDLPVAVLPLEWPDEATTTSSTRNQLRSQGLAQAPDPRLIEIIPEGVLPARSTDGTTPLAVYARPSAPVLESQPQVPMVAIVMRRAGIGQLMTSEAMLRLPPEISFALSPYASEVDRQAIEIRDEGHELFLDLPLAETMSATDDPGPKALSNSLNEQDNHLRLRWLLTRFPGYAGILSHIGGDAVIPINLRHMIIKEVEGRGLGLIESGPNKPDAEKQNFFRSVIHVTIDNDLTPEAFDAVLSQLEATARKNGSALGVANITPLAIERIKRWSMQIAEKGLRLVPASALLTRESRS